MASEKLKQLLAGVGIAGLAAGLSLVPAGQIHAGSGWGGSSGAVSAKEKAKSGWGGSDGAGGATEVKKEAKEQAVQSAATSVKKKAVKKKKIKKPVVPTVEAPETVK